MVRATQERDVLWTQDESGERRFFAWCYYVKERDRRGRHFPSQIHRIRDGLSFLTLAPALSDAGYRYAGAVLNIPAKEARGSEVIRTSKYWPGDVLLLATRPPVHDPVTPKKGDRWVNGSGYRTEQVVFEALEQNIFIHCSRTRITLRPDLTCAPETATIFQSIEFSTKQGGGIEALRGKPTSPWKSSTPPDEGNYAAGYLLTVPSVGEQRFRLVAAFSSGGTESLWWSWLLMHRYRTLLNHALATEEPRVWLGLFAIPTKAPTFLSSDDSAFALSSRKTDHSWPDIIEWKRVLS